MNRSRMFRDRQSREVLGLARGIYNEPACTTAACHVHAPGNKLLGVLDVIVSLDTVKANMAYDTVDLSGWGDIGACGAHHHSRGRTLVLPL